MDKKLLHGAHTALVTPMKDGQVSYADLENLVGAQLSSKISGVIPCGTTGESPTLSSEEHLQVIRSTIKSVNGQIPVIAGTGAPVPAITGICPFTLLIVERITCRCSSLDRVGDSPVVPHGMTPDILLDSWAPTRFSRSA